VARRRHALAALAALAPAALAAALAGCGTTRSATAPVTGKALFAELGCGSCHTLAAAGAHGTIGTNLDAHPPSRRSVVDAVTNGVGRMPSFKARLTAKQIGDLAAYVVAVTH